MKKIAVCYHRGCLDGFGGAWAAWKKFGLSADYIGLEYQEAVPHALRARDLYFIDFCYPRGVMENVIDANKRVIVLDHHESQQDAIQLAHEYRYTTVHSGCVIAWKYFHPDKKLPLFLRLIEDNDLFRFRYRATQRFVSMLQMCEQRFDLYDSIAKKIEEPRSRTPLLHDGGVIRSAQDFMIRQLVERAEAVLFEGYRVYAANSPFFYSEIANILSCRPKCAFGIAWFYREGKLQVSLRTASHGVNLADLAKRFGGGGHVRASGFSIDFKGSFPWKTL